MVRPLFTAPTAAVPVAPAGDVKREPKATKTPYSDEAYNRLTRSASPATLARAAAPTPVGNAQAATLPSAPAVVPAAPPAVSPTAAPQTPATVIATGPTNEVDSVSWQWPVTGKISKKFSENAAMRGIVVDGKGGTPIYAAAAGRVVYAGEGLRGYGKVVIVRHNEQYTSVYAHNSLIGVKEGESVKRGQKIAEMGNSEADSTRLFFEVRRSGKQLDPEKVLPAR